MQLLLLSDPAVVSSRHNPRPLCSFAALKNSLTAFCWMCNHELRLRRRCIGAQLRIGPRCCCGSVEISPVCGHASCVWRVVADYIIVCRAVALRHGTAAQRELHRRQTCVLSPVLPFILLHCFNVSCRVFFIYFWSHLVSLHSREGRRKRRYSPVVEFFTWFYCFFSFEHHKLREISLHYTETRSPISPKLSNTRTKMCRLNKQHYRWNICVFEFRVNCPFRSCSVQV